MSVELFDGRPLTTDTWTSAIADELSKRCQTLRPRLTRFLMTSCRSAKEMLVKPFHILQV